MSASQTQQIKTLEVPPGPNRIILSVWDPKTGIDAQPTLSPQTIKEALSSVDLDIKDNGLTPLTFPHKPPTNVFALDLAPKHYPPTPQTPQQIAAQEKARANLIAKRADPLKDPAAFSTATAFDADDLAEVRMSGQGEALSVHKMDEKMVRAFAVHRDLARDAWERLDVDGRGSSLVPTPMDLTYKVWIKCASAKTVVKDQQVEDAWGTWYVMESVHDHAGKIAFSKGLDTPYPTELDI